MDTAEFKQQFLPYHRKLYRVAFRLTGNPQDAEDMVQEAYLKLWNKRDELADVLNTEAYCVTLIKNLCYDVLRRSQPDEDRIFRAAHPSEPGPGRAFWTYRAAKIAGHRGLIGHSLKP